MTTMTPSADITNTIEHTADETATYSRGQRAIEPLVFEKSSHGARALTLPPLDVDMAEIPSDLTGSAPAWPELGQLQVVRHYHHLSQRNFSIDGEFYPLGSCTMKYNPRINEYAAAAPGFIGAHPMQEDGDIQGVLELLYQTRTFLEEIAGLDVASLQPAAGAHGEYTALKVMRAYFCEKGEASRTIVFAPDNAHGTNPASCAMCGAGVVKIRTTDGYTDLDHLRELTRAIREVRAKHVVPPRKKVVFHTDAKTAKAIANGDGLVENLAGLESVTTDAAPNASVAVLFEGAEFALSGLMEDTDPAVEKAQLQEQVAKLDKDIGALEGRLNNPGYTKKAPEKLVNQTRDQLAQKQAERDKANARLKELS